MARSIGELRDNLRNAYQSASGAHQSNAFLFIIFLFTLILHLVVDGPFGLSFAVSPETTGLRAVIYLPLALFVYLYTKQAGVGIAALAEVFVPYLLFFMDSFMPAPIMEIIMMSWWLFPAFAMYLSLITTKTFFETWGALWLIILFFVILKNSLGIILFPSVVGQLDFVGAAQNFGDEIVDTFVVMWDTVKKGFQQVPVTIERSINYATGGYYTGMVENQQGEPVGLYIEQIRFATDRYFEGQPIFLWADITGKSFKDRITVHSSCYSKEGQVGITNPQSFDVVVEGFESVSCMFPESGDDALTAGRHSIEFRSQFNFETWSYVTYTFVNQQTLLNFLSQDKDINRDLDIDKTLRPIYTPGPVSIGMSSDIPQPVGVSDERGLNTVFGVTLENIWTDGELVDVSEFIVLIPNVFTLEGCDAEMERYDVNFLDICVEDPEKCPDPDLMDAYSFVNFGAPSTFKSVTCRLESENVEDIIPIGQHKAQHTFVVIAKYDYSMSKKKSVEVVGLDDIR